MTIFLILISIVGIGVIAYWMRKAVKGTPFSQCHGCAPNLHVLERIEKAGVEENQINKKK